MQRELEYLSARTRLGMASIAQPKMACYVIRPANALLHAKLLHSLAGREHSVNVLPTAHHVFQH